MAFLAVLSDFRFLMIIYITFILKALYAPLNRFIRGVRGIFIKIFFKNQKKTPIRRLLLYLLLQMMEC